MNQALTGKATPGSAASVAAGGGDAAAVLVGHVAAARTLPEASRRAAARPALDTTGAAIAAHDAAGLPGIRRVIEGWGGRPDATVIGTGARVPAHNAALVNSALARAMELDDVHEQALVHATATTVPVALAVAEQAGGVSGRRFIDAVALGNDIACRLALTPGHPEHPLDDAALHAKFRSCARRLGSRGTEALLEALTHLDEVEDMRQVARLTVPE